MLAFGGFWHISAALRERFAESAGSTEGDIA